MAPSTKNPTGVVALANLPEGTTAGELTYLSIWGPLDLNKLAEEWAAAGLDENLLPRKPTEENALIRAMRTVKKGARQLLRPLPKGERGYALVTEHATDDPDAPLDYDTAHTLTARIVDDVSDPNDPKAVVVVNPPTHTDADTIKAQFNENFNLLIGHQIGHWVWHVLGRDVRAVRLRKDGGFCYIPPEHVGTWDVYRQVIGKVSEARLYGIDALRSEGVVEAVLDGVRREAQKAIEEWQAELQKTGDDALGAGALRTREGKSAKMREKVQYYETLLSAQLPELRGALDELDADLASAILLADSDDESE